MSNNDSNCYNAPNKKIDNNKILDTKSNISSYSNKKFNLKKYINTDLHASQENDQVNQDNTVSSCLTKSLKILEKIQYDFENSAKNNILNIDDIRNIDDFELYNSHNKYNNYNDATTSDIFNINQTLEIDENYKYLDYINSNKQILNIELNNSNNSNYNNLTNLSRFFTNSKKTFTDINCCNLDLLGLSVAQLNSKYNYLQANNITEKEKEFLSNNLKCNSDDRKKKYLNLFNVINTTLEDVKNIVKQINTIDNDCPDFVAKEITNKTHQHNYHKLITGDENKIPVEIENLSLSDGLSCDFSVRSMHEDVSITPPKIENRCNLFKSQESRYNNPYANNNLIKDNSFKIEDETVVQYQYTTHTTQKSKLRSAFFTQAKEELKITTDDNSYSNKQVNFLQLDKFIQNNLPDEPIEIRKNKKKVINLKSNLDKNMVRSTYETYVANTKISSPFKKQKVQEESVSNIIANLKNENRSKIIIKRNSKEQIDISKKRNLGTYVSNIKTVKPSTSSSKITTHSKNLSSKLAENYNFRKIAKSLSPEKTKYEIKNSLLPSKIKSQENIKTLVIDLDETLVHSTFEEIDDPDEIISIKIDNEDYNIYVRIRPGAQEFINELSEYYEMIIFTASMSKYADPLITQLDKYDKCNYRLFREHCTYIDGTYVKDISKLGRNLRNIIIIDNSPLSYSLQTSNGIPIKSWYDDKEDIDLFKLLPILKNLSFFYDVRTEIPIFVKGNTILWKNATQWLNENSVYENNNESNQIQNFNKITSYKPYNDQSVNQPQININIINGSNNKIILSESFERESDDNLNNSNNYFKKFSLPSNKNYDKKLKNISNLTQTENLIRELKNYNEKISNDIPYNVKCERYDNSNTKNNNNIFILENEDDLNCSSDIYNVHLTEPDMPTDVNHKIQNQDQITFNKFEVFNSNSLTSSCSIKKQSLSGLNSSGQKFLPNSVNKMRSNYFNYSKNMNNESIEKNDNSRIYLSNYEKCVNLNKSNNQVEIKNVSNSNLEFFNKKLSNTKDIHQNKSFIDLPNPQVKTRNPSEKNKLDNNMTLKDSIYKKFFNVNNLKTKMSFDNKKTLKTNNTNLKLKTENLLKKNSNNQINSQANIYLNSDEEDIYINTESSYVSNKFLENSSKMNSAITSPMKKKIPIVSLSKMHLSQNKIENKKIILNYAPKRLNDKYDKLKKENKNNFIKSIFSDIVKNVNKSIEKVSKN